MNRRKFLGYTAIGLGAGLSGLFLYHFHNLEHEDMGMMRNYLVMA